MASDWNRCVGALCAVLWTALPVACLGAAPQDEARASDGIEEPGELGEWAEGPVRWLLLPAERRRLKEVESPGEALGFIERFWALRDADPATPGNLYRENFFRLVEAADLLYAEDGVRGSLTDRGRALILLGAPSGLRISSQEALEWDPATGRSDNVRVRYLPLEIWTYQAEDLARPLRLALRAITEETTFKVSFVRDVDRTELAEGEEILELAARTALALH